MRSQLALLIVASSIIIATIAVAASPFEYPARANSLSEYGFELMATGHAHDANGECDVVLSVEGTARGRTAKPMILVVEGGTVDVEGYGTFSVIGLQGELIQSQHYIHLVIKITPLYEGHIAVWNMQGTTGDWEYDDTISISLGSSHIVVPQGSKLSDLTLTGTIALD